MWGVSRWCDGRVWGGQASGDGLPGLSLPHFRLPLLASQGPSVGGNLPFMDADPWLVIKEHSRHGHCEQLFSTHGDSKKSEPQDQSGGQLKESTEESQDRKLGTLQVRRFLCSNKLKREGLGEKPKNDANIQRLSGKTQKTSF